MESTGVIIDAIRIWCIKSGVVTFNTEEITKDSKIISFGIPKREKESVLQYLEIKFPQVDKSLISSVIEKYII